MPYNLFLQGRVRPVPHRQVSPQRFVDYAFQMGKSFKAVLSVVMSHPAFSDTSERHVFGSKVYDGVIYTSAAEMESPKQRFL